MEAVTHQVLHAEPIGSGNLMSIGRASYMLIKQYNFPNTYEKKEKLYSADSDRLESWDSQRFKTSLEKYYKDCYPNSIHYAVEKKSDEDNLKAIIEISNADSETNWTGYRVMGSVDGGGRNVYTFQLFQKNPDSKTEVYSNNDAPNVLKGKRY